jgi:hypothetical protein
VSFVEKSDTRIRRGGVKEMWSDWQPGCGARAVLCKCVTARDACTAGSRVRPAGYASELFTKQRD